MHIYVHRDGQQFGPYSIEQVRDYIESGNLVADDLAWYDEAVDWVPLGEVPGVSEPVAAEPVRSSAPEWVPPRRDTIPLAPAGLPGQISRSVPAQKVFTSPVPPSPEPPAATVTAPSNPKAAPTRPGDPFRRARRAGAVRNMIVGALLVFGGAAIVLYSYLSSSDIPHHKIYLVAFAVLLFGGGMLVLGVMQYRRD